jgi:nicotinamidase/pyrazinamidase
MAKRALIIVDMLNDFVRPDGALYCGPTIDPIVTPIKERLEFMRQSNDAVVIYLCDAHDENDKEFDRFPKHAVKGTEGAEIVSELAPGKRDYVQFKTRYSGFYGTDLDVILKSEGVTSADVVGCCTSICVMDTVGGLANRDIEVIIPKNQVADFDQGAHVAALARMEALYGAKLV